MPSVDKAIINPFEPLGVGEALLVAVSGLLIVFVMLAMLMAVILVISKIVAAIEGKGKAPAAPAPKSAAPAAKPAAAPAAPAVDEGELVAVMMAAVAEESGMSPNSFQITNISAAPAAVAAGETAVNSPMPGNIFKVECSVGQTVKAGDVLVVLEAMKMEIEVSAPVDGTVKAVSAVVGTAVNTDDLLVTIG